jgi:hypothetical protein
MDGPQCLIDALTEIQHRVLQLMNTVDDIGLPCEDLQPQGPHLDMELLSSLKPLEFSLSNTRMWPSCSSGVAIAICRRVS